MSALAEWLPERFGRKIEAEPNSGCWIWVGSWDIGYGKVSFRGTPWWAHRAVYVLSGRALPKELDHLCRVRCCVNPDHLEPVDRFTNIMRGVGPSLLAARNASVTHCPTGHAYDKANTYVSRGGCRKCRACAARGERDRRTRGKQPA